MAQILSMNFLEQYRLRMLCSMTVQCRLALSGVKAGDLDKALFHAKRAIQFAEELERAKQRIGIVLSIQNRSEKRVTRSLFNSTDLLGKTIKPWLQTKTLRA